jgi:hypothetical protein
MSDKERKSCDTVAAVLEKQLNEFVDSIANGPVVVVKEMRAFREALVCKCGKEMQPSHPIPHGAGRWMHLCECGEKTVCNSMYPRVVHRPTDNLREYVEHRVDEVRRELTCKLDLIAQSENEFYNRVYRTVSEMNESIKETGDAIRRLEDGPTGPKLMPWTLSCECGKRSHLTYTEDCPPGRGDTCRCTCGLLYTWHGRWVRGD